MPSPFPGMDPYLEAPGLWPDVHNSLIVGARELLTRLVGPNYYVRIEDRVFLSTQDDPGRDVLIPDLRIGTRRVPQTSPPSPAAAAAAGPEPEVITTLIDEEIHEP